MTRSPPATDMDMGTPTDMDMATEPQLPRGVFPSAALETGRLSRNSLTPAEAHDGTRLSFGGCSLSDAVSLASEVDPVSPVAGRRGGGSAHRFQRRRHHSTGY